MRNRGDSMLYLIEIEEKGLFRYVIEKYDELDKVDKMMFLESLEKVMYQYDIGGQIEGEVIKDITEKLVEQMRIDYPEIMKHASD